jgi:hypothetical protein
MTETWAWLAADRLVAGQKNCPRLLQARGLFGKRQEKSLCGSHRLEKQAHQTGTPSHEPGHSDSFYSIRTKIGKPFEIRDW